MKVIARHNHDATDVNPKQSAWCADTHRTVTLFDDSVTPIGIGWTDIVELEEIDLMHRMHPWLQRSLPDDEG